MGGGNVVETKATFSAKFGIHFTLIAALVTKHRGSPYLFSYSFQKYYIIHGEICQGVSVESSEFLMYFLKNSSLGMGRE